MNEIDMRKNDQVSAAQRWYISLADDKPGGIDMAKQMFPVVVVDRPAENAGWYKRNLDFESVAELGWYEHIRDPDGHELGFMAPNLENQPESLRVKAPAQGFVLSFELKDLDVAWAKWGSMQNLVLPPTLEEWGQYHFMVSDNAGLIVDLVQSEVPAEN